MIKENNMKILITMSSIILMSLTVSNIAASPSNNTSTNYTPITKSTEKPSPIKKNAETKNNSRVSDLRLKKPLCKNRRVQHNDWSSRKVNAQRAARSTWKENIKRQYGVQYSNLTKAKYKREWCRYDQIEGGYMCYVSATPCNHPYLTQ